MIRKVRAFLARLSPASRRLCVVCGRRFGWFLSYPGGDRAFPPLMKALQWVGSDLRNYQCPCCGSSDRERHLLLYMRAAGIGARLRGASVLHFAPEPAIAEFIRSSQPSNYVKCDLYPRAPDVIDVDIMAIPFASATFDVVVANHVMEHVSDDGVAAAEIRRILKPGGIAILQTPYSPVLQATWGDQGIDNPEARLQAFGQADHVRLYGRDIVDRFSASGLLSCFATHDDLLAGIDASVHGVNPREPFFLFSKAAIAGSV